MFSLLNKKAQSTAEYAIVLGLVIAAVIAMQTYVKRGMQGRIAGAADNFTAKLEANYEDQGTAATMSPQWEPSKLSAQTTRIVLGATEDGQGGTSTTEAMSEGGQLTRDITQQTQQAAGDYREYQYEEEVTKDE